MLADAAGGIISYTNAFLISVPPGLPWLAFVLCIRISASIPAPDKNRGLFANSGVVICPLSISEHIFCHFAPVPLLSTHTSIFLYPPTSNAAIAHPRYVPTGTFPIVLQLGHGRLFCDTGWGHSPFIISFPLAITRLGSVQTHLGSDLHPP